MPRVILHVGSYKTGTSAVQLFMQDERAWLAERGLYVPKSGQFAGGAHHLLGRALSGGFVPDREGLLRGLEEEIVDAGRPDLLISSELMFRGLRRPHILKRYANYFHSLGYDISILYFIRSETSAWNSAYSQMVKALHRGEKFSEFVDARIAGLPKDMDDHFEELGKPSYQGPRPLWATLRLRPEIEAIVRPYNEHVRKTGSVAAVLEAAGITDAPPANKRGVNKSPGPLQIFICRRFVERTMQRGKPFALGGRRQLMEAIDALPFNETSAYCGLTSEIAERIEVELAERRERMSQAIWNKTWEECFPGEAERQYVANDLDLLAPSEIDWDRITELEGQVHSAWRSIKLGAAISTITNFSARQIKYMLSPFRFAVKSVNSTN